MRKGKSKKKERQDWKSPVLSKNAKLAREARTHVVRHPDKSAALEKRNIYVVCLPGEKESSYENTLITNVLHKCLR